MRGGLPYAASVEHVAFFELLCVFCIMDKCLFNRIWLSQPQHFSVLEKLKIVLEKSLNFDSIKLYESCNSSC